jgi:hypothetical protein
MFYRKNNNTNKTNFIDYLNEILSLENAALERLDRRIQETPVRTHKTHYNSSSRKRKNNKAG